MPLMPSKHPPSNSDDKMSNKEFEYFVDKQSNIGFCSVFFACVFLLILDLIHNFLKPFALHDSRHAAILMVFYIILWWVSCRLIKRKAFSTPEDKYFSHSVLIFASYNLIFVLIVAALLHSAYRHYFESLIVFQFIMIYMLTIDSRYLF